MKRLLLPFIALGLATSLNALAQTPVVCEDFNSYDSTTATANYHGFYISYHTQFSFYTSTQSSGSSGPNSYKFGVDSATMITPNIDGATYIQFWTKGNGTDTLSAFYIYDSPDSMNWTLLQAIVPLNTNLSGQSRQLQLNNGAKFVKFFYDKSLGNCAFDDFCATIGPSNVAELSAASNPVAFPNPSKGIIKIRATNPLFNSCQLTVLNVIGKEVKNFSFNDLNTNDKSLDLSMLDKGVYLLRFKSEKAEHTMRLILKD